MPSPSSAVGNPTMKMTAAIITVMLLRLTFLPFSSFLSMIYAVFTSSRDMEEVMAAINTRV